jgi:methylenetetrahydrofolate--tRNA-(uracil-5-)-methyltransferase
MKAHPQVLFAGQICGVEGYVESIATGLIAGLNAAALAAGGELAPPPRATALGSLVHYITQAESKNFQPANITFDLLPALETRVRDRKERHRQQCELALRDVRRSGAAGAAELHCRSLAALGMTIAGGLLAVGG